MDMAAFLINCAAGLNRKPERRHRNWSTVAVPARSAHAAQSPIKKTVVVARKDSR